MNTPVGESGSSPDPSQSASGFGLPRISSSDPSASGSSISGGSRGGSSSDSVVGRLVVDRGLATQSEVDAAFAAMRTPAGQNKAFVDILVEAQIVTRRQLARIRAENDGDRTVLRIPGYEVIKKLGSGAMASVYLAKQTSLDRLVAIKVLPKQYSSDPAFIERFYKEGRSVAKLSDPNIVGAFDVGQVGDRHFFVMEYVDGETVYDRMAKKKRLDERDALQIVRQVASALKHAHARGFIHRDIKPKNIVMTKSNIAKLADLGLARAIGDKKTAEAERHRAFGTPYYISPEQIRGSIELGPPADIYGLGATLYHMLTGRVPFQGKSPTEVMKQHLSQELTPPDQVVSGISQSTAEIVEMMMRKPARERYQTADELLEDLDLALAGKPLRYASRGFDLAGIATDVEGEAETQVQRPRGFRQSFSGLALAVIAGLAALCVLLLFVLVLKH